jgi:hypothetical protein
MKKILQRLFLVGQLILVPLFISGVFAEGPGPPSGEPVNINANGLPVGAPIDDGMVILLALGIAYGCYKIYVIRRNHVALKEGESISI